MKSKNIGIGKVYTYRIDFTKNKGQGYVAGPDYIKTRNVGIGRFPSVDTQQDASEGLVRIDGEVRYVVPEKYASVGPQPLPVPAPMTLRFEFSQATSDPTTLGITKGTWTKLEAGDRNIWDWTYDNRNWTIVFGNKFTTTFDPDVKLIDAGDTSGVRYCDYLFNGCNSLTSVALFDISGASDLTSMFSGCSKLVVLPLFDTRNAGRTVDMLSGCSSLTTVPPFDTSKVTTMLRMFSSCSKLVSVPVFDTKNVTDMRYMFYRCTSLTEVPPFDVRNVSDMRETFRECTNVKSGALELYKQASATGKVSLHDRTFSNCGANTTTGLADLKLIPTSWGGRFVDPVLALDTTVDGTSVTISGTITNAAEDYIIDINHEQHIVTGNTFSFTYDNLSEGDYDWEVIMIGDKSGFVYQTNVQFTIESEIPEPVPMSLRFLFSNETTDPTTLGTKGTWTKIENHPDGNVWDWAYDNSDWSQIFNTKLTSEFDNNIKIIDAGDTSKVNNMNYMMKGASGLTEIALFNTENVSSMSNTFQDCINIQTIPLFNTAKVTNFHGTFAGCIRLNTAPLFDTSSATDFSNMFYYCYAIDDIPLFNTSKVTNFTSLFEECHELSNIPDFNVSNVTRTARLFYNCNKVESGSLNLYNKLLNTGKVSDHTNTFTNCGIDTESGLADLCQIPTTWGGLSDTYSLYMTFSNASTNPSSLGVGGTWTKLGSTELNAWKWKYQSNDWKSKFNAKLTDSLDPDIRIICGNLSSVTSMVQTFYACNSLTSVSLTNTSSVTSMNNMFQGCTALTKVNKFDTSNVATMSGMFLICSALTSVPLFDTSKVTTMLNMFYKCFSLVEVPLLNTSSVTNMNGMFYSCGNVESGALALYQQASATGKVTSHTDTFYNCGIDTVSGYADLLEIPQDWGGLGAVIPEPAPMTLRFLFSNESTDPTVIQNGGTWTKIENHPDGNVWDWTCTDSNWDSKFQNKLSQSFDPNIRVIETGNCDSVTRASKLFAQNSGLTSVNIKSMYNCPDMSWMFYDCSNLTEINAFDTTHVTDMHGFLGRCVSIEYIPNFLTAAVENFDSFAADCYALKALPNLRAWSCMTCNQMFDSCFNVESGITQMYNNLQYNSPAYHTDTFTDCGINTESGYNEWRYIPTEWGGGGEELPYYYISYFNDITTDASGNKTDNPAAGTSGVTWQMNKGFNSTNSITSVNGSLPESYIGKTYGKFQGAATNDFQMPTTGKFCWSYWGRREDTSRHWAGGFLGLRTHQDKQYLNISIGPSTTGTYTIRLSPTTWQKKPSVVFDSTSYQTSVLRNQWAHFAFEIDTENNHIIVYVNGSVFLECDFTDFVRSFKAGTDSASNNEPVWITEFAVYDHWNSIEESGERTYPVPTVPLA